MSASRWSAPDARFQLSWMCDWFSFLICLLKKKTQILLELHGNGRARVGGTAGKGSTREWTALFQKTCGQHRLEARRSLSRSECGWHRQVKLDRPVVRELPVHNDGAV